MKKCDEVLELLSLYIDDELDEVRAKMVREHVESCEDCKVELEQLREVVKMCKGIDEIELPEDFKDKLHQKLSDEKQNVENNRKIIIMRNRIMKTISSIAAVLLLVLVVRGVMNTGKNSLIGDYTNSAILSESQAEDKKMSKDTRGGLEVENNISQDSAGQLYADSNATAAYDTGYTIDENKEAYMMLPDQIETPEAERTPEEFGKYGPDALSSVAKVAGVPEQTPDNNVLIEFNEEPGMQSICETVTTATLASDICLTLNSENIEADKSEMIKMAGQFGIRLEDGVDSFTASSDYTLSNKSEVQSGNENSASVYKVSYVMDKPEYDKFIKAANEGFNGKISVINDEAELNTRLMALENYIKVLEEKKSNNTEELKSMYQEKENIVQRLENIKSGQKIKVIITISNS